MLSFVLSPIIALLVHLNPHNTIENLIRHAMEEEPEADISSACLKSWNK